MSVAELDGRRLRARWPMITLALVAAWGVLVVHGTLHGWGHRSLAPRGDAQAFAAAAILLIEAERRGNVAFRLVQGGRVIGEHYASRGAPVDADSRFQVASLSKWVTAVGVLALVDAGRIDLDAPVSRYLSRWALPPGEFDPESVTVRRLLSHTAGLTDGLGYQGFAPGEPAQSLEASLTRAQDAMPGADGRARVDARPGAGWRYSGAGYALLQLLIEEVTETAFEDYMQIAVFAPLGMTRSTFDFDRAVTEPGLAEFFDLAGRPATHYRFAAPAAAGLYTTAADLTRFVSEHLPDETRLLSPSMVEAMGTPEASMLGLSLWGLGVMLYAPNGAGGHVIGHDGHNAPAIYSTVRVDPDRSDAIIVLATGRDDLVSRLGSEWVLWQTGRLDIGALPPRLTPAALIIVTGWAVIVSAALVLAWRRSARRQQRAVNR
jgi:CubicO group peptidase (beta-lactamase class C family)